MQDSTEKSAPEPFWENRWKSGETPWDHGRAAPPFEEFVEREGPPTGRILVPGAGSGHDVRFFAGLGAEVVGMDIAPSAIRLAQARTDSPRASFLLGDILDPDPGLQGTFDWVVEHTCLCALEPGCRPAYASSIRRLLRPGGAYLAVFYRDPHDDDGPPFGISAEEIDTLFAPAFSLLQSWVPTRCYASRVGLEELRWYRLRT